MLYTALIFLLVAFGLVGLDLGGITPGAGGFANMALLGALVFVIAHGVSDSYRHHRLGHYHR